MALESWSRLRRWARRRRKPLTIGGTALVAMALAGWLIYDAATEPIVGSERADPSSTIGAPGGASDFAQQLDVNAAGPGGRTGPAIATGEGTHTVTLTITTDVAFTAAAYLVIDGREVELPPGKKTTTQTFTVKGKSPLMVAAAQAGEKSQNIECHTDVNGRRVDSFQATGGYGFVVCFA
ncbi:hypothetical protein [Aeromicrobium sp. Leaf350]|uniref:hypothetical protein n=1 Tax=Aeromicrobium sp. Leaf350 TaxID=2876565 RepID=UPI001E30B14B|nr:hypothetical protein [Aeromicrobium sp. Leaf350]